MVCGHRRSPHNILTTYAWLCVPKVSLISCHNALQYMSLVQYEHIILYMHPLLSKSSYVYCDGLILLQNTGHWNLPKSTWTTKSSLHYPSFTLKIMGQGQWVTDQVVQPDEGAKGLGVIKGGVKGH